MLIRGLVILIDAVYFYALYFHVDIVHIFVHVSCAFVAFDRAYIVQRYALLRDVDRQNTVYHYQNLTKMTSNRLSLKLTMMMRTLNANGFDSYCFLMVKSIYHHILTYCDSNGLLIVTLKVRLVLMLGFDSNSLLFECYLFVLIKMC